MFAINTNGTLLNTGHLTYQWNVHTLPNRICSTLYMWDTWDWGNPCNNHKLTMAAVPARQNLDTQKRVTSVNHRLQAVIALKRTHNKVLNRAIWEQCGVPKFMMPRNGLAMFMHFCNVYKLKPMFITALLHRNHFNWLVAWLVWRNILAVLFISCFQQTVNTLLLPITALKPYLSVYYSNYGHIDPNCSSRVFAGCLWYTAVVRDALFRDNLHVCLS